MRMMPFSALAALPSALAPPPTLEMELMLRVPFWISVVPV
jgi:hypothetical protein